MLLPKDYLRYRLTGEYALDKADGAGTMLFDLAARDWSPVILDALGIDPAWMPPTFEGPEVTGVVVAAAADGDGPARRDAGGRGRRRPGGERRRGRARSCRAAWRCRWGRPGVVFATTDSPLFEPAGRVHAFCHAVPGRWHLMSVMLSAAGSLRWFRDAVAPGVAFGELVDAAADVARGQRRPAVPALPLGRAQPASRPARPRRVRRTHPRPRPAPPDARRPRGRRLRPARRARPDDRRRDAGARRRSARRAAASRAPLWRQILADVLGAEIATVSTTEGAAYGAALLAAVGAGWFPTVEDAADAVVVATPAAAPGPDVQRYADAARPLPRAVPGAGAVVPAPVAELARYAARPRSAATLPLGDLVGRLAEDDHGQDLVGRDVALVDRVRRSGRGT